MNILPVNNLFNLIHDHLGQQPELSSQYRGLADTPNTGARGPLRDDNDQFLLPNLKRHLRPASGCADALSNESADRWV
ncbi:hypothetical protein PM082_000008 [Marasmius tenuissimus]|nr:hypothetical protein PM082_000008 [Marasmius tenuissimus]